MAAPRSTDSPGLAHWRRWRLLYILAAVLLALLLLGQWAGAKNEERDRGITWVWAMSPRTMQSYLVRAKAENGRLMLFTLESGDRYRFDSCQLPAKGRTASCTDTSGKAWNIEL